MPSSRSQLRLVVRPSLLRLVLGGLISGVGDWLLAIALPIYVYGLTGSTLSSATTMLLELGAALVVGQFSGVAVDRFDRRLLMIGASLAQAMLLLPLLAVHGRGELAIVYAVSAVQSALGTLAGPAESALLPSLVSADELVSANTVVGTAGDLAKLIGAAAGGVVLGAIGLSGVVLVDAASFATAALLLAVRFPVVGEERSRVAAGQSRWQQWRAGLTLVRRSRELRATFAIVLVNQLAQGIALALIVAFFVQDLHRGSAAVGVFRSFQVLGTIPAGVLLTAYGGRFRPETLLKVSLAAATVVELFIWNGPSITQWFGYYLILEILLGLPGVAAFVAFSTILQSRTPREYLGRVFGLLGATSSTALLISVAVGGSLGELIGPRPLLNVTVFLEAMTAVVAVVLFRTPRTSADPHSHQQPETSIAHTEPR